MSPLAALLASDHPAVLALTGTAGHTADAKFDNRPSWDNWAKNPAPWNNQPTWDNWSKKK